MNGHDRQVAQATSEAQTRLCRYLETELRFCLSALALGNSQATHGSSAEANRNAWVVEDTADIVRRFLPKVEDVGRRDRFERELTQVQKDLDDLRLNLG